MAQIEYPPSSLYVLQRNGENVLEAQSDDHQQMLNFVVKVMEAAAAMDDQEEIVIVRFQQ